MSDETASYEEHLDVARWAVESRPDLCPTPQEQAEKRGNYVPLMELAVDEAQRRKMVLVRLLLAKLVGELVRGEIK